MIKSLEECDWGSYKIKRSETTCLLCGQHFSNKRKVYEHLETYHRTRANTRFKSMRRGLHWVYRVDSTKHKNTYYDRYK